MNKREKEAILFCRYISEFLNNYAPNFLSQSEHTIRSYKNALTLYILYLESIGITPKSLGRQCFEKNVIENWILWLKSTRKCSPETCNIRLGSVRVFLQYVGEKDIEFLYLYQESKNIKRQKTTKKKVSGITREALSAFLSEIDLSTATGQRDYSLFLFMYGTAARVGEVLSVKIQDLHLDGKKAYVTLHGKGGKMRSVFILPRLAETVNSYLARFHGQSPRQNDYLFFSRVGSGKNPLTEPAVDKRVKKYAKLASAKCKDIPQNLHAHQFRHARATHWLEDGMNVVQVSFLLGHENLETTMKYLDITLSSKAEALATLEPESNNTVEKKWKKDNGSLSEFLQLVGNGYSK